MSVPEHVPQAVPGRVRPLESEVPPLPTRRVPRDHPGGASSGYFGRLQGRPAPDAGYALSLVRRFAGQLALAPGEDERDALAAGAVLGVARAGHLGRGPVIHDVRVGLELLGYLGGAPEDLVVWRRRALQSIHRDRFLQLELLGADPRVLEMDAGEAPGLLGDWRRLLPDGLAGVRPAEADAHEQGGRPRPDAVGEVAERPALRALAEDGALESLPAGRAA